MQKKSSQNKISSFSESNEEEVYYDAPKWLLDRPNLTVPLLLLVLGGQVYGANAIGEGEAAKRVAKIDGEKALKVLEEIDFPAGDYVGRRNRDVCSGEDDKYFKWHSVGLSDAEDLQKSFDKYRDEFCNTPNRESKLFSDYIRGLAEQKVKQY